MRYPDPAATSRSSPRDLANSILERCEALRKGGVSYGAGLAVSPTSQGCKYGQRYYLSRPVKSGSVKRLIAAHESFANDTSPRGSLSADECTDRADRSGGQFPRTFLVVDRE
jgi:hypothetical protein